MHTISIDIYHTPVRKVFPTLKEETESQRSSAICSRSTQLGRGGVRIQIQAHLAPKTTFFFNTDPKQLTGDFLLLWGLVTPNIRVISHIFSYPEHRWKPGNYPPRSLSSSKSQHKIRTLNFKPLMKKRDKVKSSLWASWLSLYVQLQLDWFFVFPVHRNVTQGHDQ